MQLNDVAMIAADTSRSRAYLQALIRNDLLPCFVLLLEQDDGIPLPGQIRSAVSHSWRGLHADSNQYWSESEFDLEQPIKSLLEESGIPHGISAENDINAESVIEELCRRPESVFIYSGFGGVLLKKSVLETGKQFLHIHGGFLPNYKGSTTNYYSLITDVMIGASSIFLTKDIDSGPILFRLKFPPPADRKEIDHIYDAAARAKVLVETLRNYQQKKCWETDKYSNEGGETYFIIHPVLKHIAILGND